MSCLTSWSLSHPTCGMGLDESQRGTKQSLRTLTPGQDDDDDPNSYGAILFNVLSPCLDCLVFTVLSVCHYLRDDQQRGRRCLLKVRVSAQCLLSFLWAGMAPVESLMRNS